MATALAMLANYALSLMDGKKPNAFALAVLKWLRMKGATWRVVNNLAATANDPESLFSDILN